MAAIEPEYVCCFITFVDISTGREYTVGRAYNGDDHAQAAREGFASMETSAVRITRLETFTGPPRRWRPQFAVEEL